MMANRPFEDDRLVLEWRKFATRQAIPDSFLHGIQVDTWADDFYRTMVIRLSKDVLVDKIAETDHTASLPLPKTWWDHWKIDHGERWLGRWWMRRWPARMQNRTAVVRIEHAYIYPEHQVIREPMLGNAYRYDTVYPARWTEKIQGEKT